MQSCLRTLSLLAICQENVQPVALSEAEPSGLESPHETQMNKSGLTELFSQCDVFSSLPLEELENLVHQGTLHQLVSGTVLINEGKTGEGIWGLVAGELDVSVEGQSINRVTEPGEVVGEIGAVSHTPATATVKAATEVYALGIPHDKLHEAMKNSPALAEALIRSMTRYLGRR